jgi:long-chain acyl-CoA synthetase
MGNACCSNRRGSSRPHQYNVPYYYAIKGEGESFIYRNAKNSGPDSELFLAPEGISTIQDIWRLKFEKEGEKFCLGKREVDPATKKLNDYYSFMTCKDVEERIKNLGSGLINLGYVPTTSEYQDFNLKMVAIYAKNSVEWYMVDIASTWYGFTTVPIYDTLGAQATKFMFGETNVTTLVLTSDHVKGILENIVANGVGKLKNLVLMDPENFVGEKHSETKELLEKLTEEGKVTFVDLVEVIQSGRECRQPDPKLTPETIFTFSYTSGTTGDPKGAMISHKNVIAGVCNDSHDVVIQPDYTHYYLSYLPLAHVMERLIYIRVLYIEGIIGVFSGDITKIREDAVALKPTLFVSVPRLYNRIYDLIQAKLSTATGAMAILVKKAVATKLHNLRETGQTTHWLYDRLIFNKIKAILGGNVKFMGSGSAPISKDVLDFLKICFCCPIGEGYGQTETCTYEFQQSVHDTNTSGHVGGIMAHLEFKLIDVPEMNYYHTDVDLEGNPTPRGEVLVRGNSLISGYYKNPKQTAEAIDEEGWLHSGDICVLEGENNRLRIVDRRKNIFKLSQGEYIAPDRLGEMYKTVRSVAEIYVYGDSLKSCLIAVVVPDGPGLLALCAAKGIQGEDLDVLSGQEDVKKAVVEDLKNCAVENKLFGFEQIKKVHLSVKDFGAMGLLTEAFKVKRHEAKKAFQSQIDALYKGLD